MPVAKRWWGCLNPTMKVLVVIAITSFILNLLKPGRLTYLGEESVRNKIKLLSSNFPTEKSPVGSPRKNAKAACAIPDFFGRTIDLCKDKK